MERSLHEQWMDLRQEGSVAEYRQQFRARAAPLEEVSKICFVSKFISGLQPEVKKELRLLQPIGLGQAMDLAQIVEDKLSPSLIRTRASRTIVGHSQIRQRKLIKK